MMIQSTKDILRNSLFMGYGLFVFSLPNIMPQHIPNEITATIVQILGVAAIGQGFINIVCIAFGIDANRSLINRLDKQTLHMQVLEDKLAVQTALIQQLVDKTNQSAANTLPPPFNLTGSADGLIKLHGSDQTGAGSGNHVNM